MSINMNGQPVIRISTPLSTQVKNASNVEYINTQTENKGSNALQGYPELLQICKLKYLIWRLEWLN